MSGTDDNRRSVVASPKSLVTTSESLTAAPLDVPRVTRKITMVPRTGIPAASRTSTDSAPRNRLPAGAVCTSPEITFSVKERPGDSTRSLRHPASATSIRNTAPRRSTEPTNLLKCKGLRTPVT